ncbi:PREDICTED: uncharacterized protein CXorf57-like isoform X2 [Cyprinodon variegatus]|uniref:uncharacterized protein CXorf57-like isoform X2 n=1 Tax=Cyprinodon variegatus TaxID=28743 RepID=UPI00074273D8|nr:PREDICTED: uncharacterized protein CXorf57-like isoform X2 [Cyprinodon variegatus]
MAVDGCILHRTLSRSIPAPNQASSSSPVVCRESLYVVDVRRYSRDQASAVYFPQAVLSGEDLYDVTLTDGDCRLQVTLDPGLNRLVERRVLKPGSALCNATFSAALSAQLPECPGASEGRDSYRLVSLQVRDPDEEEEGGVRRSGVDWDSLPWFRSSGPAADWFLDPSGVLVPLRANRSVFLPLWNSVDPSGEAWTEAPPPEDGPEDEEEEGRRVTPQLPQRAADKQSHDLPLPGRQPSVTVSELRDGFLSGRRGVSRGAMQLQLIVRITAKSHLMYYGRTDRNCECPYKAVLQASDWTGSVCLVLWNSMCVSWYRRLKPGDIISLRRYRVKQHYQAEADDIVSVVVCTRLKSVTSDPASLYLTNTTFTQVYCTGLGHHSQMSYRKLQKVRGFLRWLRSQDDQQVMSRALIGGFFTYPPPAVSLETFMKERRGELSFLQGAELQTELERLCYRERRTFCLQATVSMVTYRGEEDRCLFWTNRPSSSSSSSPASFRTPSSSFSPTSPSSAASLSTPRPSDLRSPRTSRKRRRLPLETPSKRRPLPSVPPEDNNRTVILFEASMEFLENAADEDEEEDDGDDCSSFCTAPLPPMVPAVAMETLPLRFDYDRREEQVAAVSMGGGAGAQSFGSAPMDYYTVRLKALSDGGLVDAVFLPHLSSSLLRHANTWTSILSHGAFSPHTPPPTPADLIAMAPQLANQRLVCVLEACHLGGAKTELVLTRGFHLKD